MKTTKPKTILTSTFTRTQPATTTATTYVDRRLGVMTYYIRVG